MFRSVDRLNINLKKSIEYIENKNIINIILNYIAPNSA